MAKPQTKAIFTPSRDELDQKINEALSELEIHSENLIDIKFEISANKDSRLFSALIIYTK